MSLSSIKYCTVELTASEGVLKRIFADWYPVDDGVDEDIDAIPVDGNGWASRLSVALFNGEEFLPGVRNTLNTEPRLVPGSDTCTLSIIFRGPQDVDVLKAFEMLLSVRDDAGEFVFERVRVQSIFGSPTSISDYCGKGGEWVYKLSSIKLYSDFSMFDTLTYWVDELTGEKYYANNGGKKYSFDEATEWLACGDWQSRAALIMMENVKPEVLLRAFRGEKTVVKNFTRWFLTGNIPEANIRSIFEYLGVEIDTKNMPPREWVVEFLKEAV